MIYDLITNLSRYPNISKDVIKFINNGPHQVGRYELENGTFALVQEYKTRDTSQEKLESHQKYIDIQCILDGQEAIEVTAVKGLEVCDIYDAEKDIAFYKDGIKEKTLNLKMTKGTFVVLYPEEAHKPRVSISHPEDIRKIVIKVPV